MFGRDALKIVFWFSSSTIFKWFKILVSYSYPILMEFEQAVVGVHIIYVANKINLILFRF
jgi:hypothetical protein